MNKKFSTLMAGALLALSTSAFAADLPIGAKATKVEGKKYFLLQQRGDVTKVDDGDMVIGMTKDVDANTVSYINSQGANGGKFAIANNADVNNYLWTVSQSAVQGVADKYVYEFTNVGTGEKLTVAYAATIPTTAGPHALLADLSSEDPNMTVFRYGSASGKYDGTARNLMPDVWQNGATSGNYYWLDCDPNQLNPWAIYYGTSAGSKFELYEATDEVVSDEELNDLYNSAGFNLKLKKGYEDVDNAVLNGESPLLAYKLNRAVYTEDEKFGFPKGTYFLTDYPYDSENELDFLLNSTFVAVSPTENASSSASLQNGGEGFTLTTVAGKDLNLMITAKQSEINGLTANEKPCGSTVSVRNAAFKVKKDDVNNAGYYEVSLDSMYFQKTTDAATAMQNVKKNVRLDVKSNGSYGSNSVLVSAPASTSAFIFQFEESNVIKGVDLLSADGKSVYNIQIGGNLYLKSGMTAGGTYKFFAAGSAMADLNTPAYQFVVTKVQDGTNITFTNRLSGATVTMKLFDWGEGYTVAEGTKNSRKTYEILDIQDNGDVKSRKEHWNGTGYDINYPFHLSWINLIPAEAETISGWNVADGTQVTIAFARDNTPTSNKMYPQLNAAGTDLVTTTSVTAPALTDDVAEAAQWQLVKSTKPSYKTYTYAYLDKDEKVAYKSKGDTVAYYTYAFQSVQDGNVVAKYLKESAGSNAGLNNLASATKFIIVDNWDGSQIITSDEVKYLIASGYENNPATTIDAELNRTMQTLPLKTLSKANNIKTYLVQDAPEVSLPATATYITLQSELGNYIAMNGEKDGIVISNEPQTYRVFATDLDAAVPSFLISTGFNGEDKARTFLFNPVDSIDYYVGAGKYDKDYEWAEDVKKAIFKSGILCETNDTLTTSIKGKVTEVAVKADNQGTMGGLNRFKYQIVLADGEDDLYVIRQLGASKANKTQYLSSINDKLTWDTENKAMKFVIADTVSPTANDAISAEAGVQVIGGQGVVTVQGAAGKVITVANILGQTIANQVAASDNVTIAAPAGIVVVAVEGEATKVVVK